MSTKRLLTITFSFFGFFVVIFLIYISLLGENNKIDIEIDKYFLDLKNQNYIKAFNKIDAYSKEGAFLKDNFNYDFSFTNFLALRDMYNCIETEEYRFEYKKHSFWLPFQGNNIVKVGLRVIRVNDFNTFSILLDENKPEYIDNYITMKRINGIWRIVDLKASHEKFVKHFRKISKRMKGNRFIVNAEGSVAFKNYVIDYSKLKKIDIKIIKFQLNKVENMIDKPEFFLKIGDKK